MSNTESRPDEVVCEAARAAGIEIITPRDVPLGGPRAMNVRRTLPSRARTLIGAWCFLDHYGPDRVADSGGMVVAAHPHTGLQTVSWLFTGEIVHCDSAGHHAIVRPGEVNLMTGGQGISHTEISTPETATLHGAQLWVALPEAARDTAPAFEHYAPAPVTGAGWEARVFLGSLLGSTSPVATFTRLLGAEILLRAGEALTIPLDPDFEHGVLVDTGLVSVDSIPVEKDALAYLPPGSTSRTLVAAEDTRLLLLGGPPFGEQIVMWWNFVGRSHEEIVTYRDAWQAQIIDASGEVVDDGTRVAMGRFGRVDGEHLPPIPAPPLPGTAKLRPRG
ncbi:pirin family protein [Nocardioides nematodiphilus]|uniref:pirin family protein n=1 Tax=Nocardioides nematodiphilus TaxID=2849669 RepID=UPI001CDA23EA|nr:pirin family protein [Nocardioides nematodiphilus]MCA1981500.1 pirin family protein [Nocardioides nematodiphilus]